MVSYRIKHKTGYYPIVRLTMAVIIVFFLVGCGSTAQRSEFWKHDSVYKDWNHMKFSLFGFENPTDETAKKSKERGWWGITVE